MESHQVLEKELAAWAGYSPENVVVTNSGTSALHIAFEALQLPPSSEVILSDFNMIACPRAVSMAGLKPVFVDCGHDLLFDPHRDFFNKSLTPMHTARAVLATHIYGRKCNMEATHDFTNGCSVCTKKSTHVVEDLAEAHGVKPHPDTDAACWSFYKNKIIHGEEGGAVSFKNPQHASLARQLRSLGFTPEHDFMHLPRGHNYRLANCLADRILCSLREVDRALTRRREIEGWYDLHCPLEWRMPRRDVVWVYDVRLPTKNHEQLMAVVRALNSKGIQARCSFKPMSLQKEYLDPDREVDPANLCWNAFKASQTVLYLPVQPWVTRPEDCQRAFRVIQTALDALQDRTRGAQKASGRSG